MSAAEKLRALEHEYRQQVLPDALVRALPQIVAVIEAAEASLGISDDSGGDHRKTEAALAALDEALS